MRLLSSACLLLLLGAVLSPAGAAGLKLGQSVTPPGPPSATPPVPEQANAVASAVPGGTLTNELLVQLAQDTWSKCGHQMQPSAALSQAAQATLSGLPRVAAIKVSGFAALNSMDWTFTARLSNNQSTALTEAFMSESFLKRCDELKEMNVFGLYSDGQKLSLVTAREAVVDLSQKERWLKDFLALTNEVRAQARVCGGQAMPAAGPLVWDEQLSLAAEVQVSDMIRLDFTGHVNPKTGSQPRDRVLQAGFRGQNTAENLAYGVITPQDAINNLLASPGHCVILMDARYSRFGAAVGNGTASTRFPTYWAQVFGQP